MEIKSLFRVSSLVGVKNFVLVILLVFGVLLLDAPAAQAARTLVSLTVDGGSSTTVAPSGSVTGLLTVNTSGSGEADDWESTLWRISTTPNSGGTTGCVDSPNITEDATGATDSFSMTAPTTAGNYNTYVTAYSNNGCAAGGGSHNGPLTLTNSVHVALTTVGDGTSPSNKTVQPSDTNKAVSAFTLVTTGSTGTDTITDLVITGSTTTASNVASSGVKIYQDNGSTANEYDASDTLKGTTSFSGSTATFSGINLGVTATSTQYIVTYDISASPTNGQTLNGRVSSVTATRPVANNDTTDATLTVDNAAPSATFDLQTASDTGTSAFDNLTNATSPIINLDFSEAVTGLDASDLSNTGTATGCSFSVGSEQPGNIYPITVSSCSEGTLIANLAASAVTDGVGNTNALVNNLTVTIDRTAPDVTVEQAVGQDDPTSTSPINFTATFTESIYSFAGSDVTVGGTTTGTKTSSISDGLSIYNIAISGMTSSGTVVPTISAAKVKDLAGNDNNASTSTDNSVDYAP